MLIIGAKGFAKEVLEILNQLNDINNVCFYDDVTKEEMPDIFNKFRVLRSMEEVRKYFIVDTRFTIGIGGPVNRYKLYHRFINDGGVFTSTISPKADIGHFGNMIDVGCNIMTGTVITNDIRIDRGVLINLNCTIGHDSHIGQFVEMSPGVHVSGNCTIGDFCNLGTNCTILPKVKLGKNVIVGAGAVVTKEVPDNCLVVGIPAAIKKEIAPIDN